MWGDLINPKGLSEGKIQVLVLISLSSMSGAEPYSTRVYSYQWCLCPAQPAPPAGRSKGQRAAPFGDCSRTLKYSGVKLDGKEKEKLCRVEWWEIHFQRKQNWMMGLSLKGMKPAHILEQTKAARNSCGLLVRTLLIRVDIIIINLVGLQLTSIPACYFKDTVSVTASTFRTTFFG